MTAAPAILASSYTPPRVTGVHAPVIAVPPANYQQQIDDMVDRLSQLPQCEMPVTHRFSPGIYIREIFMPKGAWVIGHKHKTQHFNIVLSGRAKVMMDGVEHLIEAPCIFESDAGVQKILHILEDMRWQTVHANPNDERDHVKLEEQLVELSDEMLLRKGGADLDTMRLRLNESLTAPDRKELV